MSRINIDTEVVKDYLRWFRVALIWGAGLLLCVFLLSIADWSGATGWFLLPLLGATGSLVGTILGICDGNVLRVAHNIANYGVRGKNTYKRELNQMYREAKTLSAEIYRYRNNPSLHSEEVRRLRNLNMKIAKHKGLLPED